MRKPVYSDEWGEYFESTLGAYMESLENGVDDGDREMETLSGKPYCGCSDCYERERLLMAVALTLEGHVAGDVRLETEEERTRHA